LREIAVKNSLRVHEVQGTEYKCPLAAKELDAWTAAIQGDWMATTVAGVKKVLWSTRWQSCKSEKSE
jgi:hypothetical protein